MILNKYSADRMKFISLIMKGFTNPLFKNSNFLWADILFFLFHHSFFIPTFREKGKERKNTWVIYKEVMMPQQHSTALLQKTFQILNS